MILKEIFNIFLNFFYPTRCIFCHKYMEINTKECFCDECKKNLKYLKDKICCVRCGNTIVSFNEKQLCYNCLNETHFYYKRISSIFEHADMPRDSVLRYKTNPRRFYAKIYAKLLYDRFLENYDKIKFDFICAVPPDKKRTVKRGADHIGLICEEFSNLSGIPYFENCLKKIRKTKKQSTLSYTERQTNLLDSIRVVDPEKVKNKNILIIDDVCTTTSTMKECAKELKFADCKNVYALTILRSTTKKPKVIKA